MVVGMSSTQAYKAHKQEGTLVSKVHKQGTLGTSSQASLHQRLLTTKQVFLFVVILNCLAYPTIIKSFYFACLCTF